MRCLDCGVVIDPSPSGKGPQRLRCEKHRLLRKRQLQRARTAQLRAEGYGVVADLVIADEVFERDNWICHLCGKAVPKRLRSSEFRAGVYEPLAPVVDHVIPLSRGGPHTMDNCRLAHWTCNSRKFDNDALPADPAGAETAARPRPSPGRGPRCSVEGCGQPVSTRGMCRTHYGRDYRNGHPLRMRCGCGCGELVMVDPTWNGLFYIDGHGVQTNTVAAADKLRENLVAQPVSERGRALYGLGDDCLVWTGPATKVGYGVINVRIGKRKTRREMAHRLAYELAYGEGAAVGLTVDHLCGVPLCCNPNHLEAVTLAENVRRAALAVTECPQGHPYDEKNTLRSGDSGYRICRRCNRNRYHLKTFGHDFIPDPDNASSKRERCLTCRQKAEATTQLCPQGHEYTPENTKRGRKGERICIQCQLNRRHVEQYGHEFVIDDANPSTNRRRCRVCVEAAAPVTHCSRGHEYTPLTLEFSRKGHRKCAQCRLDAAHVPKFGHAYVIDPSFVPGAQRRCLVCAAAAAEVTHCKHGHAYTPENTKYHRTRGHRICVMCQTNGFHVPRYGHEFVADPHHTGKLRRCLVCAQSKT